jgi:antitoxin ParD1/3/4
MSANREFTVTLPEDLALAMEEKIKSGEYSSKEELIEDGVRTILSRDDDFEAWLRQEVVPALDRMKADPSRAISLEEVRRGIALDHERLKRSGR